MSRLPMFELPSVGEDGSKAVRFGIKVTLADAIAFDRSFRRSAEVRRSFGYVLGCAVVVAAILGFASMLAARAALSGSDCDLDASFGPEGRLRMFLIAAGSLLTLELVGGTLFLWKWLRGTEARHRARRVKRPGVDPADPELAEDFLCAFNREGFRFHGAALDFAALWTVARRVEETADHMLLYVAFARAYVIPKREVAPAAILAVRDLAREAGKLRTP